jgi:RNA polymerase sigma factor (sigma-70 family)
MRVRSSLTRADQRRFNEAFEAEFPSVYRFLRRRVGRESADELCAETFALAYEKWHRYDAERPVRPWLYGIAINLIRHHYRDEERKLRAYARTGVDPLANGDEVETIHRVHASAQRRRLAEALARLRPNDRDILLLHAWAELEDREIAMALSIPVGTVKSRLHRTRARLRNSLEPIGQPTVEAGSTSEKEL